MLIKPVRIYIILKEEKAFPTTSTLKISSNYSLQLDSSKIGTNASYYTFRDVIILILATVVISVVIYIIPDFLQLQILNRDIIVLILQTIGVDAQVVPSDLSSEPALYIIGFPMTIGRGCVAMEAGACILALITVTHAPLKDKLKGGITFVVILFVANILRLTTNFVLIFWGFPFWLAHDTLNKLFALVGIVIASFILEKQGIPIINEVANWMEVCLLKIRNRD